MKSVFSAGLATIVAVSLTGAATAQPGSEAKPGAAQVAQAADAVLVPFTDHYTIRIEKPAAVVWGHLKRLYVEGERMRQQGFAVSNVTDDAAAYLGAVRGVRTGDTDRPEVTIMVSAMDEKALLLSLMIVLENPVPVYVIHQVRPDGPNASIYQTIIQTKRPVMVPKGVPAADFIRKQMSAEVAGHNKEVAAIMQREKTVIEALD